MHSFGLTGLAMICAALALSVQGAEDDVEKRPAAQSRSGELSAAIQDDLRADPLYSGLRIQVDIYQGLAIIHGSAPNENAVAVITDRLRHTRGIEAVFNYMVSPDKQQAEPASMSVSFDDFQHMERAGFNNNAFTLGQRAKDRLDADGTLSQFDLSVDTYKGLVILHGNVPTAAAARRARDIAAYTPGAEAVLSYIDVAAAPALAPVTAAPILVRPATVEIVPTDAFPIPDACGVCR